MKPSSSIVLLFIASTAGCASPSPTVPERPALRVGVIVPATEGVAQSDLVRAEGTVARYRHVEGRRAGTIILQKVIRDGNRIALREEFLDGRGEDTIMLSRREDGLLEAHFVDTFGENTRSVFAHPLPFAPPRLEPGACLAGESPLEAVVLDTADGPRPERRAKGRSRRELRILGDTRAEIEGRPTRVAVVEMTFSADLDLATARSTVRLFVERGTGIVAEERSERVMILGIIPRNATDTIVLESITPPRNEATAP